MSFEPAALARDLEVEAAPGDERGLVGEAGQVQVGLEVDLHGGTPVSSIAEYDGAHGVLGPLKAWRLDAAKPIPRAYGGTPSGAFRCLAAADERRTRRSRATPGGEPHPWLVVRDREEAAPRSRFGSAETWRCRRARRGLSPALQSLREQLARGARPLVTLAIAGGRAAGLRGRAKPPASPPPASAKTLPALADAMLATSRWRCAWRWRGGCPRCASR